MAEALQSRGSRDNEAPGSRTPAATVYLVAGRAPWSREVFDEMLCRLPGRWHFVGAREELTPALGLRPRYIFFLHWSWLVPETVLALSECVGFHLTDLPYGRGGSPLQNLILRGHRTTQLTALRMTSELDAGPVYFKEPLSLEGGAGDIYRRASRLAARMIERLIREQPEPKPQAGEVVRFERRRPEQSEIPPLASLEGVFDFIRMLDAEGYPRAFLCHEGFRYEFSDARINGGSVEARVVITPVSPARP